MANLWPGTEDETGIADKDWGTPVPIPSHSPTVVSRDPSEESVVLLVLEPWDNHLSFGKTGRCFRRPL